MNKTFRFILLLLSIFIFTISNLSAQKRGYRNISGDNFNDYVDKGTKKRIISGNVQIEPEKGFRIFCDKATQNLKTQDLVANGNVHVIKGNSINLYSDKLIYDFEKGLGKFRNNVRLVDDKVTLTTNFLDFNSRRNSGFFYNGGQVVDSASTLTSKKGYYYPKQSSYTFVDSVVVHNKQYDLYSDTLKYDLRTSIVSVFGATQIVSENNKIYCKSGWYDTKKDIAWLNKRAYLVNDTKRLSGDSLYYNQSLGIGKAYYNVELLDTAQRIIIRGEHAKYIEEPEVAFVTGLAVFMQYQAESTDTMFLHADTLKSEYDTTGQYKVLKAYHQAQLFKSDFQARSDSIVYSLKDSIIRMYQEPVMWSDVNQITADLMEIFIEENKLHHVNMKEKSFIVTEDDTSKYNQIKGIDMQAWFKNSQLYRIDVDKDCNSVYYAKDKDDYIGMNSTKCEKMSIHLKNKQVRKVVFMAKPESTMFPLLMIPEQKRHLKHFRWLAKFRPMNKNDIFKWSEIEAAKPKKNDEEQTN